MTNIFDGYEVLGILGNDIFSACYKLHNKTTCNTEVWKAINCEFLHQDKRDELVKKIRNRSALLHPNLLSFYDCILHEETNTLYLVTEYCKFGSLFNIVKKCIKKNTYVSEDFIWKLLYKITCSLKSMPEMVDNLITTEDIYLDEQLNIKFYYFSTEERIKLQANRKFNLAEVLYELCTLQSAPENKQHNIPSYYSTGLRDLYKFLLNVDFKCSSDVILQHPTALTKVLQKGNNEIFVRNNNDIYSIKLHKKNCISNENEAYLKTCVENIRNRELLLQANEDKLKEKEHNLNKREKKITLMEKIVKQKILQADIYLKRSRKRNCAVKNVVDNDDNFDTSLSADCGDSVIVPTSRKLDVGGLSKPFQFTSPEKRVKFKGHSPLKEIHNIENRDNVKVRQSQRSSCRCKNDKRVDSTSSAGTSRTNLEKARKKFSLSSVFSKKAKKYGESVCSYEEIDIESAGQTESFRPISWTEETKRHAFDLLRIMNAEQIPDSIEERLKHTSL